MWRPLGCKLNGSFYSAFLAVANETVAAVRTLATTHPFASIVLNGHSLGAAYVALLAMELWNVDPTLSLAVVTFGQKRVGNAAVAKAHTARLGAQTDKGAYSWRLTHFVDLVPHLPFEAMGFVHVECEVHYGELNKRYTICDGSGEGIHCADGLLAPLPPTVHCTLGDQFP